jgi:Protein of unknown function (DUF3605)
MGSNESPSLPYWQVNVPPEERELTCPPYLRNLAEKEIDIIRTPDNEYHVLTWPEVRSIIAQNRLDVFQRLPSELRRYLAYNYQIKLQYGSVMAFVLSQKLGWTHPIVAEAEQFKSRNDISIKWNDWPYGINEKIVHLVVWTKFDLAEDPVTTDLTDEARGEIDAYVKEVFGRRVGEENVSIYPPTLPFENLLLSRLGDGLISCCKRQGMAKLSDI